MRWHHIKWKIKQFPNLIIRLITFDHYYICDECHCVHKRDGTEIRFDIDDGIGELMSNKWWYSSVCREGHNRVMDEAAMAIRNGLKRMRG